MIELWLYAYVVLPLIVISLGYALVRYVEREDRRDPAE